MADTPLHQLDGHDAAFLYSDTSRANANVSLLHIYDQSTVPGGRLRFKTILAHIESRLHRAPMFRRKLQRVPLELDYPYWVDDEQFDLEYHVRHIALPKPGDWRQFCIQVSRIHARPLALDRPLWEIYVIEGLDSFLDLPAGSFALLAKVHHAAIDPERGSELTLLLHDEQPHTPAGGPPEPWFPHAGPGTATQLRRGAWHALGASWRLAGPVGRTLRRLAPAAFARAGELLRPERVPVTRFNSAVSPYRVFETRRFQLAEFKALRTLVPGASVHDAALAVCGGALRRYLLAQGELPDADMSALAPVSTRGDDELPGAAAGVSWMSVSLGTAIEDPVERLRHIHAVTAGSSTVARAVSARELSTLARHAPAATLALTSKMLTRLALGIGRRAPLANCTITNVPGPARPQFLCGARMTYFSAIMPISDGMGLVFAVTSYDGQVIVSPTSCRELMPDPEVFAQCVRDSFQELLAAASRPALRRAKASRRPSSGTARPPRPSAGKASARPRAARAAPRRSTARSR